MQIWAFGITAAILLCGVGNPFTDDGLEFPTGKHYPSPGKFSLKQAHLEGSSPDCIQMMEFSLRESQDTRVTARELEACRFFRRVDFARVAAGAAHPPPPRRRRRQQQRSSEPARMAVMKIGDAADFGNQDSPFDDNNNGGEFEDFGAVRRGSVRCENADPYFSL